MTRPKPLDVTETLELAAWCKHRGCTFETTGKQAGKLAAWHTRKTGHPTRFRRKRVADYELAADQDQHDDQHTPRGLVDRARAALERLQGKP